MKLANLLMSYSSNVTLVFQCFVQKSFFPCHPNHTNTFLTLIASKARRSSSHLFHQWNDRYTSLHYAELLSCICKINSEALLPSYFFKTLPCCCIFLASSSWGSFMVRVHLVFPIDTELWYWGWRPYILELGNKC